MTELVIAILLWMNCVNPGTYCQSTIQMHINANQPKINSIISDTLLSYTVWVSKGSLVPEVEILDDL